MEIKEMNHSDLMELINSAEVLDHYSPKGLFFIKENDGSFTGVDNSTGEGWMENFFNKDLCFKWLRGEVQMSELEYIKYEI